MASGLRRRARKRAAFYIYTGLAWCLRNLPEPIARFAAGSVALMMLQRRGMTVRMRVDHLRRVLRTTTGAEPDPRVLGQMTRQAFRAYARYWVEGARLPKLEAQHVDERMWADGQDILDKGMAAGNGVVMALPHVGSWEWGGSWLDHIGYHMTSVAEVLEPDELFRWFIDQRRAMGLTIVPLDNGASGTLIKTLKSGGLVGLLCDRDLVGNGIEVEFFGERTTFPGGPATLALRTGAMLITTAVFSDPGANHHAVIRGPIDTTRRGSLRSDVARITQAIAADFEEFIRRAPEQWHMCQPNWPSDHEAERARKST
ncbi:MAG: phosphatidylinositol mannoside acyltransferase [Acidimicrobiales bacterium]